MLASLFLLLNAYTMTLNNCWATKPRSWPNIGFRLWWGRAWEIWMTAGRYHACNGKGHHLWISPQHAIKKDTLLINEMVQSFFQTVKNLHVMYIEWTVMVLWKSEKWLHICLLVTKKLMLGDEYRDDFIVRINMNNIVNSHFFVPKDTMELAVDNPHCFYCTVKQYELRYSWIFVRLVVKWSQVGLLVILLLYIKLSATFISQTWGLKITGKTVNKSIPCDYILMSTNSLNQSRLCESFSVGSIFRSDNLFVGQWCNRSWWL